MNYWLVKADPDADYSIDDLVYIYHSQKQKSIVGLAKVSGEPFENKEDPRRSWAMRIKFEKKYDTPLHLSTIKEAPECQDFALVRIGRLSVMPVEPKIQKWLESKLG